MTDDELKALLGERIAAVEARVTAACQRAGRPRNAVAIVAITKTVSVRVAGLLPELGLPDLGENRPQELWKKAAAIPGATWHFTGHLQRNKIEQTLPLISMMHTLDSFRLAKSIDSFNASIPILLELNCSRESAKGGFAPEELRVIGDTLVPLEGLLITGLMTMAAHSDDPDMSRSTFVELRELRDRLESFMQRELPHLSMGMSNDFEIAIEEGATHIRLGTVLFEGLEGV